MRFLPARLVLWLRSLFCRTRRVRVVRNQRAPRRRIALEPLETRSLLSAMSVVGSAPSDSK